MDGARDSGERAEAPGAGGPGAPGGVAGRWRARAGLASHLERERARWFVWLPVAFGLGIMAYFTRASEPDLWIALALPATAAGLVVATRGLGLLALAALVTFLAALGFAAAKLRTEWVRAPVLASEMRRADVTGIVEMVEPRPDRGERITLSVTAIRGLDARDTPARIRVRTMAKRPGLKPGDAVRVRASLRPPSLPAYPGGYDFARTAWFQGIGATGYALRAAEILPARAQRPPGLVDTLRQSQERLRQAISERIAAAVPGEAGAIAVSLITGQRGAITDATNDAYRDSGLVHVLSISGLHMVIMAGSIFVAVRVLLAAFPAIALTVSTKKWAAAVALLGAAGYLLISGASIPTVRAFVMIAIMFVAVLLDRQALAMRNVALAALVVLAVTPESLLDPGFQMSFAAVVALVAAYEAVRSRADEPDRFVWLRPVLFFFGGVFLSTIVASAAVAPFGAYHFHHSQQYALLANLLAAPICNLVVMPAALLTLVLMPLGLEAAPLSVMAMGIDVMTAIAYWVASLPGAVLRIPEIPDLSFALMAAGGLWLAIWQTRWRALGAVAIGAGLLTAGGGARPDIVAGRDGDLVAVRGEDGRLAATSLRAGRFELLRWLEHDGDARTPREALAAGAFRCDGAGCTAEVKGLRVAVARHASAPAEDCRRSDILIAGPARASACTRPLAVLDRAALRRDGTHALYLAIDEATGAGRIARIETVAGRRGDRPWTGQRRFERRRFEPRSPTAAAASPRGDTRERTMEPPQD